MTNFELPLSAGHAGEFLIVNPTETGYLWSPGIAPVGFFVQENAVSLPQRPKLNFINFYNVTDNGGNNSTDVDLDVMAVGNNALFTTTLVANNTFTTALANDNNFVTNLTANATFITNLSTTSGLQAGLQFQDEGVNLGTTATADTVNFVGAGVTATRVGNTITATIAGGGGSSLTIQDGGVAQPNEPALNFQNYFTLTNNPGVANNVDIDGAALAGDATFVTTLAANNAFSTALIGNTFFTTSLGNDVNFISTLTSNATFITNVVSSSGVQTGVQYKNEGVNLGTSGTVNTIDFVGQNITATRIGNTVTATVTSPLTTKGDVYTYSTLDTRLPVGTNGQVLTADSTQATGLKWATGSSSGGFMVSDLTPYTYGSGTTAELPISGSLLIPAGTLGINNGIEINFPYIQTTGSGGGSNISFRIKFNGVPVLTFFPPGVNGTNQFGSAKVFMINQGATNSQLYSGNLLITQSNTASPIQVTDSELISGATAIDFSLAQTVTVTAQSVTINGVMQLGGVVIKQI